MGIWTRGATEADMSVRRITLTRTLTLIIAGNKIRYKKNPVEDVDIIQEKINAISMDISGYFHGY